MGFFSKIWKGLKKGVKKIGKGIKSAFKKFGKFMNKIGILGQVAMFFILPGIGEMLGSLWTGIAGQTAAQGAAAASAAGASAAAGATAAATATGATAAAATAAGTAASQAAIAGMTQTATGLAGYTGALSGVANAAGSAMRFVGSAVSKVGTVFNNVTQGITETLGNFAKTASNKLFGTSFDAAANFFGSGDSAWSRSFGESSRISNITQSKDFFEARDTVRANNFKISQTEKALNTPKGQKAMADTVAEGYGNDGFGFDSEYSRNIQANIDAGRSNYVASLDPNYVPDPAGLRLDITDIDNTSLLREQGLSQNVIDNLGVTEFPVVKRTPSFEYGQAGSTGVLDGINVAPELSVSAAQLPSLDYNVAVPTPSLMERLQTGISEAPTNAYKKLGEIADDPLGYAGKGMEERFQSGVQTRLMQEAGIVEKPEYIQNYVSNNAYVPSFESFGGAQQQYGASEIMNARSFEQQVTNNPSPYGYTAFQYNNFMAQFGQTA
jgi:hypothetical protein